MVPVDCAICRKTVSLFDVSRAWKYSFNPEKGKTECFSVDICNDCMPESAWELAPHNSPPKETFSEPEPGSQDRFEKRRREVPWVKHTFWWLVHNCVSHPLIGILPLASLFRFHDWTSVKMHGKEDR